MLVNLRILGYENPIIEPPYLSEDQKLKFLTDFKIIDNVCTYLSIYLFFFSYLLFFLFMLGS